MPADAAEAAPITGEHTLDLGGIGGYGNYDGPPGRVATSVDGSAHEHSTYHDPTPHMLELRLEAGSTGEGATFRFDMPVAGPKPLHPLLPLGPTADLPQGEAHGDEK